MSSSRSGLTKESPTFRLLPGSGSVDGQGWEMRWTPLVGQGRDGIRLESRCICQCYQHPFRWIFRHL